MHNIDKQKEAMKALAVHWTKAQPVVTGFIGSLIPDFHDAEDVLQHVAVIIVEKFDQYDPNRRFVDWAVGIARYEVLKYQRRYARDRRVFRDQATVDVIAKVYTESAIHISGVHQALNKCLSQLKKRDRQLLEMWYVREQGSEKIMRVMGVARKTVYVLLYRLRRLLRECVERRMEGEGVIRF